MRSRSKLFMAKGQHQGPPPPINPQTKSALPQADGADRIKIAVYVLPEFVEEVYSFLTSINHPIFPAPESPNTTQPSSPVVSSSGVWDQCDGYPDPAPEVLRMFERMSVGGYTTPMASPSKVSKTYTNVNTTPGPSPSTALVRCSAPTFNPTQNRKYFAILRGKVTGVYWQDWYVVEPFVKSVPGAIFRGFKTKDEAFLYFYDAKLKNRVSVVRNPGDDVLDGDLTA